LDNCNILWLLVLLATGAAAFWLKDRQKKLAVIILYLITTLYVGGKFYQSIFLENRLNKATPAIDVDRAELMLRLGSAIESVRGSALDSVKAIPGTAAAAAVAVRRPTDVFLAAQRVLERAADAEPESAGAWAKLIIVEHERKADYSSSLEHLSKINTPSAQELANSIKSVFRGPLEPAQIGEIKRVFREQIPDGWYRARVMESLYRKANDKVGLEKLRQQNLPHSLYLFFKMVALAIFGVLAVLIGLVIIFFQLLFVGRSSVHKDERALVKAPVYTSPATIYGVFIAWLTAQSMIGSLAQSTMKSISPYLKMSDGMESGSSKPVLIALTVAALYLLSNGPGPLFAYVISLRPAKIPFFEGFRLRTRVGKQGPVRLVLEGLATWFMAVPLVLVASIIGYKLGATGSSNPIIALVMEAARAGNIVSTVLFYLTLGVLAPLCEETLFRGFLYASLRRSLGVVPSMLLSAGLFAGFHLDLGAFLPLFTLGCLFALTFERTKSILPSMVAHGLWNSGTFTLLLLLFGS